VKRIFYKFWFSTLSPRLQARFIDEAAVLPYNETGRLQHPAFVRAWGRNGFDGGNKNGSSEPQARAA
jgi:hypothetical protein